MKRLIEWIETRGWRGRVVPIERLADLRRAVSDRFDRGEIDAALYRVGLSFCSYEPPAELPGARSIVIVAVPTPPMRVAFEWQGEAVPLVVPPTYVSYIPRSDGVRASLRARLGEQGYGLVRSLLPLKTLAVCSGLAEYGRNNICYVCGMGSYLQLVGGFTDMPCDEDPWREPKALDLCDTCSACRRNCPTSAIPSDRFLIHAERCLTYHNEAAADFPKWIDPSWHHCLVGCMRCQLICPENKPVLGWYEDRVAFSEAETRLFVRRTARDQLPEDTAAKLASLEINEDYAQLCRNLAVILERGARGPTIARPRPPRIEC